jgi:hypothetical protein
MNRETSLEIMNSQQEAAMMSSVGALAANVLTPVVSSVTNSLTSVSPSGGSTGGGGDYGGDGSPIV